MMYRSPARAHEELMVLYGEDSFLERDNVCISEENDLGLECNRDKMGNRGVRSSLSLEIHGLQREEQVFFTNQEYYRRLEELKSTHLKNMADLERMYISQGKDGRGELQRGLGGDAANEDRCHLRRGGATLFGPTRKLQRINSQEELDFHDSSSGSDQSELYGEDRIGELRWSPNQERTFDRSTMHSPEMVRSKNFGFPVKASYQKPQRRIQATSKVTVPKPFQMMLREEERKRHRVRTRSEIELENTLLRQELEELKECQKKFRASPAPAHIHLPLYEILSRRQQSRSSGKLRDRTQEPFQFLERERRKREAKIVAELGNYGQRDEREAFRARAAPGAVYRPGTRRPTRHPRFQSFCILEREATEGQSDPSSDVELDVQESDSSPDLSRPQGPPSCRSVKKQIQVSIEMK